MNKPVVFLDFDGVLNTEQYQAELAISGKACRDKWGPLFDPRAVSNLKNIIDETNASIIVTSTWRYIHGLDGLKEMWEARSLPGKIMGILPCDSLMLSRGEVITEYVSAYAIPSYIIIDDIDEFGIEQKPYFIKVNPVVGISKANVKKAIESLKRIK